MATTLKIQHFVVCEKVLDDPPGTISLAGVLAGEDVIAPPDPIRLEVFVSVLVPLGTTRVPIELTFSDGSEDSVIRAEMSVPPGKSVAASGYAFSNIETTPGAVYELRVQVSSGSELDSAVRRIVIKPRPTIN